jgi:HPt (histidine-containing phosphotransfer) domain-containing protein/HAMP domain-containing protein
MKRLKFGIARKLAVVCLAFGLPIVVMLVLMTRAKLGEIDFAEKEIVGDRFQRPLEEALQHVARHRRLWLRSRRGEADAGAIAAEQRAIAGALEKVAAEDALHGVELEFTREGLGLRQRDEFTARNLDDKWRLLRAQLSTIGVEEGDRAHQALITHIGTMITHAGDCSNLILDPDLDSYYLMDVTLLALPQMEQQLQQIAVDVERLHSERRLTLSDRIRVAKSVAMLKEASWDRVVASAGTALNEDPNFHGVSPTLGALRSHLALGTSLTQRVTSGLEKLVQESSFDGFDGPAFRADVDALEAELYELHHQALDQEDALIAIRIGDFRRSLHQGFVLAGISVLLSALLAFMVAGNVVRRVLRVSATTEAFGRGDMTARVGYAGSDEIGDLARSFDELAGRVGKLTGNLEQLVAERTAQLTKRNREFALILDNVHQGMLTVDLLGRISSERSAAVAAWFGEPEPEATLAQYLGGSDPTAVALLALGLEELRSDVLPHEVLLGQMPAKLVRDGKHFSIAYRSVYERETLTHLLVIVSDVTGEVEARRATALQQETLRLFQACQRDRGGFLEFFVEAREIVDRVRAIRDMDGLAELKRGVHTLKGNCALYGIFSLSELCHRLETNMEESGGVLSPKDVDELQSAWRRLSETATQILGERAERKVEVHDDEYGAIIDAIACGRPRKEILASIAQWKLEPSSQPLQRLADQATGMATRLGKPVDVRVEASDVRLCAEDWAPFWSALVHAVRNAVDHGIEGPEERVQNGKPGGGTLRLATRTTGGRFLVEVSDDGRGIDWARVAERAKALGLRHTSPADLSAALFADGLSTKDAVSEISGRGIGMSAIREVSRTLGGHIDVESTPGKGTTLRCSFPEAAMGGRTLSAIVSRPVAASLAPRVA